MRKANPYSSEKHKHPKKIKKEKKENRRRDVSPVQMEQSFAPNLKLSNVKNYQIMSMKNTNEGAIPLNTLNNVDIQPVEIPRSRLAMKYVVRSKK